MMIKSVMRSVVLVGTIMVGGMIGGGCATMVSGTHQMARFESDPPGATVRMGGSVLGETPCKVRIKKADITVIEFALDGYQPRLVNPNLEGYLGVEMATYGNILPSFTLIGFPLSLIGLYIDNQNGSMYRLKSPMSVALYSLDSNAPQSPAGLGTPSPPPARRPRTGAEPVAVVKSSSDRLAELSALKEQGVLTQEEYDAKRQKIIDEL